MARSRFVGRGSLFCVLAALAAACSSEDETSGGSGGDAGASDAGSTGDAGSRVPSLFADREPDATVTATGPSARIDIARDELGIPHIYAETVADGAFAIGYLHASDRLAMMDLFRHLVMGRLSEYMGSGLSGTDIGNRTLMMTRDGRQVWDAIVEGLDPDILEALQSYSAGVNVVLAEIRSGDRPRPPGYDDLDALIRLLAPDLGPLAADEIPDWTPADTIAVARLQQQRLSESSGEDMRRGELMQSLPAELFADLIRTQPVDPTVILEEFLNLPEYQPGGGGPAGGLADPSALSALSAAAKERLRGLDLRGARQRRAALDVFGWDELAPSDIRGSNNWVIAGEHTESGSPMVFNDPHLQFAIPPLFYHVHSNTRHYGAGTDEAGAMIGITFPGIPSTLIGHNEYVAWGATVVGWDVTDVYVEQLNPEGTAVMFNGEWVDILQVPIEIGARGGEPVTATVEVVPHHGPIDPDSKSGDRALSIRWTGQEVTQAGKAHLRAMRAQNIDEWMEAMATFDVGGQNWNGADVDGNTGYAPFALVPRRTNVTGACDPTMPVDGTGPCEWDGFLPVGEIPHVKNRAKGYVITANNDVTGTLQDNDPTNDAQYLHSSRAVGFRAGRITERVEELIAAGGNISLADMQALQADTKSLEAERLVPFLLSAADTLSNEATALGLDDALDRLRAWDFTMPSGVDAAYRTDGGPNQAEIDASVSASIFNMFLTELRSLTFADDLEPYGINPGSRELLFLLENPTASQTGLSLFDDIATTGTVETPDEIMLTALAAALDGLATRFGSTDSSTWRWGEIHQVEAQDLFGEFGVAQRTLGPYPRHGGNYTVDVANAGRNGDGNYIYRSGPQMRFYAIMNPDGIESGNSLPGGQIDDPNDPHYDDLFPGWLRNETFEYYFTDEEVVEHTEELIVIEPG